MPPLFDSDPSSLLANFPKTQALVRAGVIAVGVASAATVGAGCTSEDEVAPTCGICCHSPDDPSCREDAGSGGEDAGVLEDAGMVDAGMEDAGIGPTCGPCCHGGAGCDGGL